MITPSYSQRIKSHFVNSAFVDLSFALKQRGKLRIIFLKDAALEFESAGLVHHALICRQLAQGKRYYPRLIRPSI